MTTISYPESLPCPQSSNVTAAERRMLSSAERPRDASPLQRDRLSYERVTWPPLTTTQSAALLAWWKDTLIYGGSWFAAAWPSPRGSVTQVRKFLEQPKWDFVPGGFWRLSATIEVRGIGLEPTYCLLEPFLDLSNYATVSGNRAVFTVVSTPYGNGIDCASQNVGTIAEIKRTIAARILGTLTLYFKMPTLSADDATRFFLYSSSTVKVLLTPRREGAFDATQRGQLHVLGETLFIGASALAANEWYRMDLTIAAGAGNTVATFTRISTGLVAATCAFTQDNDPPSVNEISFADDNDGTTTHIIYSGLEICPP